MIVLDENGKLIINKLEVSNSLSSSIIKKYNFNNMRKEFHEHIPSRLYKEKNKDNFEL